MERETFVTVGEQSKRLFEKGGREQAIHGKLSKPTRDAQKLHGHSHRIDRGGRTVLDRRQKSAGKSEARRKSTTGDRKAANARLASARNFSRGEARAPAVRVANAAKLGSVAAVVMTLGRMQGQILHGMDVAQRLTVQAGELVTRAGTLAAENAAKVAVRMAEQAEIAWGKAAQLTEVAIRLAANAAEATAKAAAAAGEAGAKALAKTAETLTRSAIRAAEAASKATLLAIEATGRAAAATASAAASVFGG